MQCLAAQQNTINVVGCCAERTRAKHTVWKACMLVIMLGVLGAQLCSLVICWCILTVSSLAEFADAQVLGTVPRM